MLGSGVDTNQVKATKTLPPNIDVSSANVGINYDLNKTNYRFNPRSGNELQLNTTIGIKTLKRIVIFWVLQIRHLIMHHYMIQ